MLMVCALPFLLHRVISEDRVLLAELPGYRDLGMANTIGIDRVLFTTDYPYASMKAALQFFDQMPINANDKEKIAHLNAERLLGLGQNERRPARRAAA